MQIFAETWGETDTPSIYVLIVFYVIIHILFINIT